MGGIGVILLFFVYVGLSIYLVTTASRVGSRSVAIPLAVFLALLPFADAVAGRWYLKHLCESSPAVTIRRTLPPVDGIRTEGRPSIDSADYYGYRFVEGGYNDRFSRSVGQARGKIPLQEDVEPIAGYMLSEEPLKEGVYIDSQRTVVRPVGGDAVLGEMKWYSFKGGWAERIAGALSDAGSAQSTSCGDYGSRHAQRLKLLHGTLPPSAL